VKIRGFRVELDEVESALAQNPAVSEAVVLAAVDASGQKQLVAYAVPRAGASLAGEELRQDLRGRLPQHMVPTVFMILPALPRPPVARSIARPCRRWGKPPLRRPGPTRRRGPRPRPCWPRFWADVLGVAKVGIHDDFFELGGASIKSMRIVAKVEEAGLSIPAELLTPETLFEHPTIAQLAALWEAGGALAAAGAGLGFSDPFAAHRSLHGSPK